MIDNWNALPLGKYERLLEIQEGQSDENELTLEVLAFIAGTTVQALMDMPLEDYYAIRAQGAFLLLQPEPAPIRKVYEVGGWRLVPVRSVKEMTAAQFIDFQEWCRQPGRHTVATLSCFLVPEGKQYGEGYDAEQLIADIGDHLPMTDAVALDAFFFSLSIRSMAASLSSLERALTPRERMTTPARKLRKALRALRRSGAGWRRWTPLLSLPAALGMQSTENG